MKKIFSLFAVFMMILVMMPTATVLAAEENPELSAGLGVTEVMYGALIKDNSSTESNTSYTAYYSIRQSKYKNSYGLANNTAPTLYSGGSANASDGICKAETHYNNWSYPAEQLCTGTDLNPVAASYSLNGNGDLKISLQNDFEINRLNIYYIVAGVTENTTSDTAVLMCSEGGPTLSGNWKNKDARDRNMIFSELSLEGAGFTVQKYSSGRREYSGYNVLENMSGLSKNLALKVGAYVIVTMSVDYVYYEQQVVEGVLKDVKVTDTYYINTPIITGKKFESAVIGGSDTYSYAFSNVQHNPIDPLAVGNTIYAERMTDLGSGVDAYAALVSTVESVEDNGLAKFYDLFDNILRPVIMIALGVLLVIKGSSLIITIIKSSDEPQVRKDSIKHLITLFVSVFVVVIIMVFMKDIIEIIADLIAEGD